MSDTQKEIEVKILVSDFDAIEQALSSAGASLVQERVHERNMRYEDREETLTSRGIVLRLRQDERVTLTYKGAGSVDRGIVTRDELEVEVSDYDTMAQLLKKFGYHDYMFYEKYRTTYELDDTQVMLDELPYGNFVEVEGSKAAIERVLETLGLSDAERREHSYSKLFDFVKHHLELNFQNLTFENFEGVDVPESAFVPPGSIVIR